MKLTKNDRRMLSDTQRICDVHDGCCPHGSADWIATRRLLAAGLVESIGVAMCADCDCADDHEAPAFRLTNAGVAAMEQGQ